MSGFNPLGHFPETEKASLNLYKVILVENNVDIEPIKAQMRQRGCFIPVQSEEDVEETIPEKIAEIMKDVEKTHAHLILGILSYKINFVFLYMTNKFV